ncbi:hypothetical protein A3D62_00875 [Candidatus Kaiserbacteria bacterium RIFCSPHIGHO2_02_FULL_49_11]|uniref:Uncharacterized protein n=1 Tax=Candidatus Kaiserbacteria bacterium RIFCSPHIGHO2_02_FULL_49_11 TaxID=1798489 RepID=A0A1F6D1G8_9BACT|nr:MAG: hypothetical protein A3D62_00875 [Candidatus Kaiserbacteria bacterium RIFCSPHIGHO2_02_FULL_49_11]
MVFAWLSPIHPEQAEDVMTEFVSGLPFAPAPERTLDEALKSLEANVKGFDKPMTAGSIALTKRIANEREAPVPERYRTDKAGQFVLFDNLAA